VGASPLTKPESQTSNSSKHLKNNDKNEFFTIRRKPHIVEKIEYFSRVLARLRLVKSDSGRVTAATIV
jgi:hypothetical protein